MTRTIQFRSLASLSETGKKLTIKKPETEDNISLFLSLCDSMNKLYEALNRLDYVLERKILEKFLCLKKGEKK